MNIAELAVAKTDQTVTMAVIGHDGASYLLMAERKQYEREEAKRCVMLRALLDIAFPVLSESIASVDALLGKKAM